MKRNTMKAVRRYKTESNKNKKIQANRKDSATIALGKLEKNMDMFLLTGGQFSLIDALMVILDQTGPAHVSISTWSAAQAHLEKSAELMGSAEILSLRLIVDRSYETRQPLYYTRMVELFGHDCIRAIPVHSKFMTVRNDKWDIIARTSMNLNENPRLEYIEISENEALADFFDRLVTDIFKEVSPAFNMSDQPSLITIPDTPIFKTVTGNHIKWRTLNEPKYTHTMQN